MERKHIRLSTREKVILNDLVRDMGYYGEWCFYVTAAQDHRRYGGYIPAMVFRDVPNYFVMNGPLYSDVPFIIGQTFEEARQRYRLMNEYIGLDSTTVAAILESAGQYAA